MNRHRIACPANRFSQSCAAVIIAEIVVKYFVASAAPMLFRYLVTDMLSRSASVIGASCSTWPILPWRKRLSPNNEPTIPLSPINILPVWCTFPEDTTHNIYLHTGCRIDHGDENLWNWPSTKSTSPTTPLVRPFPTLYFLLLFSGHRQIYILRVVSGRTKPCCLVQFAYLALNNHTCAFLCSFLYYYYYHHFFFCPSIEAIIWLRKS